MNSILSTESKKHKHALNKVSIFLRRLGRRGEDEVMVREGGGKMEWNRISIEKNITGMIIFCFFGRQVRFWLKVLFSNQVFIFGIKNPKIGIAGGPGNGRGHRRLRLRRQFSLRGKNPMTTNFI